MRFVFNSVLLLFETLCDSLRGRLEVGGKIKCVVLVQLCVRLLNMPQFCFWLEKKPT